VNICEYLPEARYVARKTTGSVDPPFHTSDMDVHQPFGDTRIKAPSHPWESLGSPLCHGETSHKVRLVLLRILAKFSSKYCAHDMAKRHLNLPKLLLGGAM